jgi:hypothetical protein
MTKKKKIPLQMPVGDTSKIDLNKLDKFASKADYSHEFKEEIENENVAVEEESKNVENEKHQYPWQKPAVREDIDKSYAVPISEPDYLKLKFISQNTPYSMRKFCREVVSKAINEKINEIT